jgi:hypothetical protein
MNRGRSLCCAGDARNFRRENSNCKTPSSERRGRRAVLALVLLAILVMV